MFEILERCIDLCLVSHRKLNSVVRQGMDGRNINTTWKVTISNNWVARPTKNGRIWFSSECILNCNFQRASICWRGLSLLSFWITASGNVMWRAFWINSYYWWITCLDLNSFFVRRINTVYTSCWSWMFWFLFLSCY